MNAARQQIGSGPFGDDNATADLLRSQRRISRLLHRIARRIESYDKSGALILECVARRHLRLGKEAGTANLLALDTLVDPG